MTTRTPIKQALAGAAGCVALQTTGRRQVPGGQEQAANKRPDRRRSPASGGVWGTAARRAGVAIPVLALQRGPVRTLLALAVAGLLLTAAALRADIDVSLFTAGDLSAATVWAGSTLALYTRLSTTPAEGVGGLFYTVEAPDTSWSIATRDYASYGWYHNDGLFDQSTPVPATSSFPVSITDGLFALTPGTADFSFDTMLTPAGTTMSGGTIETFSLTVPLTNGVYELNFGVLDAFDGDGGALSGEAGHGFTVTVVPEPSGLLLLGLATAVAAGRRRRRRG